MLLIEDLILVTIWLLVTVIAINLVFLAFVFYRRWWRTRYYRAKDEARERYRRAIAEFVAGEVAVQTTAGSLAEAKAPPERDAIQELLLDGITPQNADRITELFYALKYVEHWSRTAFGRKKSTELMRRSQVREQVPISTAVEESWLNRFRQMRVFSVPRALAVDHLGNLAPENAQVFMAEALHDPSTEVRRVAVAAMGRSRNPAAIPLLLDELHKAISEGNDVSLRTTKAALVCYQLADLQYFIPHVTHPNPRMRFFVVDTLREICNRAGRKGSRAGSGISSRAGSGVGSGVGSGIGSGVRPGSGIGSGAGSGTLTTGLLTRRGFPPELCEVLLQHSVNDSFADVRARAAALVAHFRDAQAVEALRKLLGDENEFVRLHAVRMCADRYYGDLIPEVLKCMADTRWRVREAAVKTLGAFGVAGLSELYKYFVSTGERYESEQIAEEIQRTGMVDSLLTALGSGGETSRLAEAVCRKLTVMGKTSLLTNAVAQRIPTEARLLLMEALMAAPTPRYVAILETLAETDGGPVGQKARDLQRQVAGRSGTIPSTRGGSTPSTRGGSGSAPSSGGRTPSSGGGSTPSSRG